MFIPGLTDQRPLQSTCTVSAVIMRSSLIRSNHSGLKTTTGDAITHVTEQFVARSTGET
jgi:hypothetical protein